MLPCTPVTPVTPPQGTATSKMGDEDADARADFDERAGIAENDGGLSQPQAEVLAAISTAPGDIDPNARAKVIDFAARHLEHMNRVRRLEGE